MNTRWRVTIIEDDEDIADMLANYLSQEGYDVVTHESREEALVAPNFPNVDLVIMDYMMPGMGPEDFIGTLRSNSSYVPIILMSALPNVYEHASRLGVSYVLRKPMDLRMLGLRIKQVLAGRTQSFVESVRA